MSLVRALPSFVLTLAFATSAEAATIELKNDGFVDMASVGCQGGFLAQEEGASTLGPVDEPFTVQKVRFLFCGASMRAPLTLKIYEDTGSAVPGALLFSNDYIVAGADNVLHEIDLSATSVSVTGGSIRVSIVPHQSGYPGIARDGDGYTAGVNWIYSQGSWVQASSFGITGECASPTNCSK